MMEMPHTPEVSRETKRPIEVEKPSSREQWLVAYGDAVRTALTATERILDADGRGDTEVLGASFQKMKSLWSSFPVMPELMAEAETSLETFLKPGDANAGSRIETLQRFRQNLLRLQKYGEAMAKTDDEAGGVDPEE